MTTDTTKTEHEWPITFRTPSGHVATLVSVYDSPVENTDTTPADLIACLSANTQLRAAVLDALLPDGYWDMAEADRLRAAECSLLAERNQLQAELEAARRHHDEHHERDQTRHEKMQEALGLQAAWPALFNRVRELRLAESALAAERARVVAAEAMVEDARFLVSWFEEDHRWANTAQERAAARILASRPAEQAKDSEVPACPECRSRETGYRRSVPLGSGWAACPNAWHQVSPRPPGAPASEDDGTNGVAPSRGEIGAPSGTAGGGDSPAEPERAAPVAEEPWTRPVTAVQALQEFHEACARDGLSVDAEHVLAASHPEPEAAQPPPAQEPPLTRADVTAIVDARVGELARAASMRAGVDHHSSRRALERLQEAAEAGKP